ncbi:MAG TPA: hypothetical protein DDW50_12680 [Firmicutes bacterium]|jgi:hypothetical protein|nr:hypothetical protein [Bacillota bacterium]
MKKIKNKFKILQLNPIVRDTVVVELNSDSLTAVEVANRNNGGELVRFVVRSFPVQGFEPAWLKTLWHQEHFSQHRVIYCLPPAMVEYKSLVMPHLPLAELEEAVKLEIAGGNNGHPERLVKIIDWQNQGEMLLVNVALINMELLKQDLQRMKEAGLDVIWSGFRFQGLRNFINFNSGFFEEPKVGAIYLDLGAQQTELGIIRDEALIFRRQLAWGCSDLLSDQDPGAIADFEAELRLTLAAYQADTKSHIPFKLMIFNAPQAMIEISRLLAQKLGLRLFIPEKIQLTGVIPGCHTARLAPLIGLSLDDAGIVPREAIRIFTPEQDAAKMRRENLLIACGIGLILAFFIGGISLALQAGSIRNDQTGAWLSHKSSLLTGLRRLERQTNGNKKKIKQLDSWLVGQNQELEFLLLLKENLPDGTQIIDLNIENGIVKDLSGVTPSTSFLLNKFKGVPGLENLKLKGTISASLQGEVFQLEGVIADKEPPK